MQSPAGVQSQDVGWRSLSSGLKLIREDDFNMVMKKYTVRGFLMANLSGIKNLNNRMTVFNVKG